MADMSEPQEPTAEQEIPKSEPKKPMSPFVKKVIWIGILLFLFIVQDWYLVARGNGLQQETFKNAVSAMSVPMQTVILTRNTDRARPVVTGMATAGGYSLVLVTDPEGRVMGSSDRTFDSQTIGDMKSPTTGVQLRSVDGGLQATCPIALGGNNVIGTLRVVLPQK